MPLPRDPRALRTQLEADFALMKDSLQMCLRKEDWHSVMDALADLREIVARLSVLPTSNTSFTPQIPSSGQGGGVITRRSEHHS